jgi:hypothetical protein
MSGWHRKRFIGRIEKAVLSLRGLKFDFSPSRIWNGETPDAAGIAAIQPPFVF